MDGVISAPDGVAPEDWLHRYLHRLEETFDTAAEAMGGATWVERSLAGRTLRFGFAGEALKAVILPAVAQLERVATEAGGNLQIRCWDQRETGVALPPAPWRRPNPDAMVRTVLPPAVKRFRLSVTPGHTTELLYHIDSGRAVLWVRDAGTLPNHWYGSPLLDLYHWWSSQQRLHVIHAGCVGTAEGGMLLAGRGGSGKSTTALLCLQAGLRYVSDDYCLLAPGSPPVAHCLYNSGKLHRDHLERFEDLQAKSSDPNPDRLEKPIIFVHEHFPEQVATSLPLRAVVLPQVTNRAETRWEPISAGQALRGLAPSTIFQMPTQDAASFAAMAALVRQLPCYQLLLGSRFDMIPPAIETLSRVRVSTD